MIAATPKAVVWNSAWPVAWRSGGRSVAMVRTTATMTLGEREPGEDAARDDEGRDLEDGPRHEARP